MTTETAKMLRESADANKILWFQSMAWNLGLKAVKRREFKPASVFFIRFSLLCSSLKESERYDMAYSMLLAADSMLQHATDMHRHGKQSAEVIAKIEQALKCIARCRQNLTMLPAVETNIENVLQASADDSTVGSDSLPISRTNCVGDVINNDTCLKKEEKLLPLLVIAECQALCLRCDVNRTLDEQGLNSLLEAAAQLKAADAKNYVNIAGVLTDSAMRHPTVTCRALKMALGVLINEQSEQSITTLRSYDQIAAVLRTLITNTEELLDASPQVLQLLKRGRQLIQESGGSYPPQECHWLMVKSWNTGVYFANLDKRTDAQQWMALAMGLLKHVPDFPESRKRKMSEEMTEVLRPRIEE